MKNMNLYIIDLGIYRTKFQTILKNKIHKVAVVSNGYLAMANSSKADHFSFFSHVPITFPRKKEKEARPPKTTSFEARTWQKRQNGAWLAHGHGLDRLASLLDQQCQATFGLRAKFVDHESSVAFAKLAQSTPFPNY